MSFNVSYGPAVVFPDGGLIRRVQWEFSGRVLKRSPLKRAAFGRLQPLSKGCDRPKVVGGQTNGKLVAKLGLLPNGFEQPGLVVHIVSLLERCRVPSEHHVE